MPSIAVLLKVSRGVALCLVAVMIWYFATRDGVIRADNPFLLPDALLTVLLLTAAVLPARLAVPGLIAAFSWAAAVWTVSLCTYATRDAFADGANHFALIIPSLVCAGLLTAGLVRERD